MRLLLLLEVAAALSSGALPPSTAYKPTQTGDRAVSWIQTTFAASGLEPAPLSRSSMACVFACLSNG